jgi:hypothetical protein
MPAIFGQSQTVDYQSVTNAATYGTTILSSTSGTYALVGAITLTFTKCIDGMKLYAVCRCGVSGDTSSVASAILRVNDNGTIVDLPESEAQSNLLAAGQGQIVPLIGGYTVAHCGTSGSNSVTISLMGRRVIGSNPVLILNPIVLQARLARD